MKTLKRFLLFQNSCVRFSQAQSFSGKWYGAISGESSISTLTRLEMKINPEASYLYGNGRTMASGSSNYG